MATVTEVFNSLDPSTDGASIKYQNYLDVYEEKFRHIKNNPISILEIGIEKGGSLSLWKKYFTHPDTKIVGLDINPGCKKLERDNIKIIIGSQTDIHTLGSVTCLGPFDIIIDDGGHRTSQHIETITQLFTAALKPNGYYIIEDTHTCFRNEFIDGNQTIYDVSQSWCKATTNTSNENIANEIQSIEYYNSLIVIRKTYKPLSKIRSPNFDNVPYPS
jgi:hypothetical protein